MTVEWPNMVAWIESMTKAANAARRVASFVIQWFHHSSGVCASADVDDCREPLVLSSRGFGGESRADLPISARPRRMSVMVVAWWMWARSCSSRVEYIFSYSSRSNSVWNTHSLAGGLQFGSWNISHRRCHAKKLDSCAPAFVICCPCALSRHAAPMVIMAINKRFGVLSGEKVGLCRMGTWSLKCSQYDPM